MCTMYMQVPMQDKRGCQISWNWGYKQLWTADMDAGGWTRVLFKSSNGLNHWAFSPASQISFNRQEGSPHRKTWRGMFYHSDDSKRLLSPMEYFLNYIKTWMLVYLKIIMLLSWEMFLYPSLVPCYNSSMAQLCTCKRGFCVTHNVNCILRLRS